MNELRMITREAALARAKAVVEDAGDERRWLTGRAPNCYESPTNYAEIHQLEGSPARGYVIDIGFGFGGDGMVIAFGMYGRRRLTIKYGVPYFREKEVVEVSRR